MREHRCEGGQNWHKAPPAKGKVDVALVNVISFTKAGIFLPCSNDNPYELLNDSLDSNMNCHALITASISDTSWYLVNRQNISNHETVSYFANCPPAKS